MTDKDRQEFEEYIKSERIGILSFVDWDKTECDLTGDTVYCSDFTRDLFFCYMGGKESGLQHQQQRITDLEQQLVEKDTDYIKLSEMLDAAVSDYHVSKRQLTELNRQREELLKAMVDARTEFSHKRIYDAFFILHEAYNKAIAAAGEQGGK